MATENENHVIDDLRLDEANLFDKSYEALPKTLTQDAIRPIASAFCRNMSRVVAFAEIAPLLSEMSMRHQVRFDTACLNVLGTLTKVREDDPHIKEIEAEYLRLQSIPTDFEKNYRNLYMGQGFVTYLSIQTENDIVKDGIRTLLTAQVVGAWTAYETLMTDLWVECVNRLPISLGNAVLTKSRSGKDSNAEKALSFDKIRQYNYDLRSYLGTLLQERFNFNRLDGILSAYDAAFGSYIQEYHDRQCQALGKEIADGFRDMAEGALKTLEALRNVLVHRGGIADRKFLERIKHDPGLVSNTKVGEAVLINGAIAAGLSNQVSNQGQLMLWMADHILSTHSE